MSKPGNAPGEMARRVRKFDWSRTPLGPVESWPPTLRLNVEMILASSLPMGLRWGPELIVIYNDGFRRIVGDRHPAALGRPLREAWPEVYPTVGALQEAMLRGERQAFSVQDFPLRVSHGKGDFEDCFFTISYSPIPDDTAEHGVGGILTTVIETTEHVRKEEALRALTGTLEAEVAERIRERDHIWRVAEDLLGVSNFAGYFTSVNPAWTRLLGWSEDEIKRMHVSELRHPDDAEHSMAGRRRLAEGVSTVRMENRFRHRDGSWRWLYWTMTADQGLIYVIGRHVTAEKEAAAALERAQAQLAQSQKMEALGQLTGGIAHDFNNMLMVVGGNAQILKERLGDPRDRRAVEAIELAAARGEQLTRQLLSFSRRQDLKPAVIGLGEHLMAFRNVLVSSARGDIQLVITVADAVWPVVADAAELELALVNLVINSRDAMPEGGTITITAENCCLAPQDNPEGLAGDFVALTVADTGTGVAPDILPKVFDPFFTTKLAEKGTGLGLSQVYGFTRQSSGGVTIASRPGDGCAVTMYLPRGVPAAAEPSLDRTAPPTGSESVLLVEDNPEVAAVAEMMLGELGYRVSTTDSAQAALALLDTGAAVDLVFSDIVMPGELDGLALAHRLRAQHPHVAIVLSSGYASAANTAATGFSILRKPYQLAALGVAVREALDGRGAPPLKRPA